MQPYSGIPRSIAFTFLCTLTVFCIVSHAGKSPDALFTEAKQAYGQGDYSRSYSLLKEFVNEHGTHNANRYLVPLLIESALRLEKYAVATQLYDLYKTNYPESEYMPRLYYLYGYARARLHDPEQAINAFSRAMRSGVSASLDSLIMHNVKLLCTHSLSVNELTEIGKSRTLHERIARTILYSAIKKAVDTQRYSQAQSLISYYFDTYNDSRFHSEIKNIRSSIKRKKNEQVQIAVLAPISGYHASIGKQIIQGAQLAADRYNRRNNPSINLVIRDTRGDMVTTAQQTLTLRDGYSIVHYLGPILSSSAVVSASLLLDHDAVLLTPTATDAGIANLGKNIFQMNSTLHALGNTIADYAFHNLNIRDYSILAPWSEYGKILAKQFKSTVEKNGGKVISVVYFQKGAHDFKEQFNRLRKDAAHYIMRKRARKHGQKSLDGSDDNIASIDSSFLADSTIEIGGLFVPAQAEDAAKIARQSQFYKIRTQLLGSTGWHDNTVIIDGDKYVNNAIISSNFSSNRNNEMWPNFEKEYTQRFGKKPQRTSALAYDGMQLLLKCIQQNGGSRRNADKVCNCLFSTKDYQGLSGSISFDSESGTNNECAVYKITKGSFVRIK